MMYTLGDEETTQDPASPGPVKSAEPLIRWFIKGREDHIHPDTNKVVPNAISLGDLKENGLSIDRLNYATPESVKNRIGQQVENALKKVPDAQYFPQIAKFKCSDVRHLQDDAGERAFVVIDKLDPNNLENVAHASIFSALKRTPSELRGIRLKLIEFFNSRFSFEDMFPAVNTDAETTNSAVTSEAKECN